MKNNDNKKMKMRRRPSNRHKGTVKFQLPKDTAIDYKDVALLQKFLNDRGKIIPRRITGVTAKEQRKLAYAVKRARFLALLPSGNAKR